MRNLSFAPGEYYHLYGRGNDRQKIFLDKRDFARFLFLITHMQFTLPFSNITQYVNRYEKKGSFGVDQNFLGKALKKRSLELVSYCLMENHFHLIVRNLDDGAASVYMHRILMGYGKYFNAKYGKKGHVFEGPFGAVHIENNTQLLHASAYIHKNSRDIEGWSVTYYEYPHSSLQDYINESRWDDLLKTDVILDQFKSKNDYKKFVDTSTAKEYSLLE